MKGKAVLLSILVPAFGFAQGTVHIAGTFNLIDARPSGVAGAWQAVRPDEAKGYFDVSDMNGAAQDEQPLFSAGVGGLQGRSFGPYTGTDSLGNERLEAHSAVASPLDYTLDASGDTSYVAEAKPQATNVTLDQSVRAGDLAALGVAPGGTADVYAQLTLRAGSGFGPGTDENGLYEMGISAYRPLPNGQNAGSSYAWLSQSPTQVQYKQLLDLHADSTEIYLLGANANDPSADPEARWTAPDAVRIDTLSGLQASSLIASRFDGGYNLTSDITIGLRFRSLTLPFGASPNDDLLSVYQTLGGGHPAPEPAPLLALGLGAAVLCRRRRR